MTTKIGRANQKAHMREIMRKDALILAARERELVQRERAEKKRARMTARFYAGSVPFGGRKAITKAQTRACEKARRKQLSGPQGGSKLTFGEQQTARGDGPLTWKRHPLDPCKLADPRKPARKR